MKLQSIIPLSSFGIQGPQGDVKAPGFAPDHELMGIVPSVNPHYLFRPELRLPVMNFLVNPGGDALGLVGPTGAGNPASNFPSLSGQHATYIKNQLNAFRKGERANDAGKMMRNVAAKMTDAEIEAVAEYIAGLK